MCITFAANLALLFSLYQSIATIVSALDSEEKLFEEAKQKVYERRITLISFDAINTFLKALFDSHDISEIDREPSSE